MWYKVRFNAQNVEHNTGKAVLIKMPNNSGWKGYKFWHPSKLVREEGGKGYFLSFSFTEEFQFKIFTKTREEILDHKDILEAFQVGNDSIEQAITNHEKPSSYLIVDEPTKIEGEVEEIEELKRKDK